MSRTKSKEKKKVTASIKKPIYYANQTSTVTNEVVNFNPANNPITPETLSTVYTIDPFAIFTQEGSTLKVKIPFTRFYRIKYALTITNTGPTSLPPTIDQFSIAKPIMTCSETISLKRLSDGVTTKVNTNVYAQDGSGYITHNPVLSGAVVTGYDIVQNLSPAIVEGIVELYAGDILTFEHTRTIIKKSQVTQIQSITSPINSLPAGFDFGDYYGPVTAFDPFNHYTYAALRLGDFPFVSVTDSYRASASFFFEISEITDL